MDVQVTSGLKAWEQTKQNLKAVLGTEIYESWFGSAQYENITNDALVVSVPTPFLQTWLNGHYRDQILACWPQAASPIKQVTFKVRGRGIPAPQQPVQPRAQPARSVAVSNPTPPRVRTPEERQLSLTAPLDSRYTFETFIEAGSNRVAHAAAHLVATGNRERTHNPLTIYARGGCGKTHLLQAIAAEALRLRPSEHILYLTAERWMWCITTARSSHRMATLWAQIRAADLVLIDDLHFLQEHTAKHPEADELLDYLARHRAQVVVAADRSPSELSSLHPHIRSFLLGGLVLRIEPPDYEVRLGILQQRRAAARRDDRSLAIPDHVLEHVALNITRNARELEGAWNQLLFRGSFESTVTTALADDVISSINEPQEQKHVRIEDIQRVVATHYGVTKVELLSSRRTRTVVRARQIAMYLSKIMTSRSLPEIGRRFGGRDHTTVLHAIRKMEYLIPNDPQLANEIEHLKNVVAREAP